MPKPSPPRSPAAKRRAIRDAAIAAGLPPPSDAEFDAYLGPSPTFEEVIAHITLLARERAEKPK